MKSQFLKMTGLFIISTLLTAQFSFAANSTNAFKKLKTLQGVWTSDSENSKQKKVVFEVISGGTALLEKSMGMVTVYHLDGQNLMATHYCEANNQPRLVAQDFQNENVLVLQFKDVTNTTEANGYITQIKLEYIDADHVRISWMWKNGSAQEEFGTNLTRKK